MIKNVLNAIIKFLESTCLLSIFQNNKRQVPSLRKSSACFACSVWHLEINTKKR